MSNKSKKHHNQSRAEHNRTAQTRSKAAKPVKKEHGVWLIIALVLMAVHGIVATFVYNTARLNVDPNPYPWMLGLMLAHSVLNIVAAAGIWFWQKWALYVYAFSAVLAVVAGLLTGYGMYSVFYMILPVAIVGWLLRTKWDYFEK